MADVLKHSANRRLRRLLPEQQILDLPQWPTLPVINHVIPRARVTIKHSRRFYSLPSVFFPATLALERVVCIACSITAVLEQLTQAIETEMAFYIFGCINHA